MNEEKKVLRKGLTTGVHTCFAFWSVLDAFIVTKEFSSGKINKIDNDDLDVTKGCEIVVSISNIKDDLEFNELSLTPQRVEIGTNSLEIYAGIGVGVVTKKGLKIKPDFPAINPVPLENMQKIFKEKVKNLENINIFCTVSVTNGEEIAKRTFNPRLGIEGGISIIGTSGIVKPFSSEAFINSIRKSMEVAKATRNPRIVISSGAKSERFIKAYYPDLPAQAFVHYGNFIGETLKIAAEEQVPHVTLGVMMGKAGKLAEGNLDTHSKKVTMNKEFIQDLARQTGCSEETLAAIGQMNLARELWDIIPEELLEKFGKALIELCHRHCDPLLPNGELTILLITENGKIYS